MSARGGFFWKRRREGQEPAEPRFVVKQEKIEAEATAGSFAEKLKAATQPVEIDQDHWGHLLPNRKASAEYYTAIERMRKADWKEEYTLALRGIKIIRKWLSEESKMPGGFVASRIPTLEFMEQYLWAHRDVEGLRFLRDWIKGPSKLNPWVESIRDTLDDVEEVEIIYKFISDNPGFLQNKIGKEIDLPQRYVANYIYWANKFEILRREKYGKTYKVFVI